MFKVELNFTHNQLESLLAASLRKWSSGAKFEDATVNCTEDGIASGYAFLRPNGQTTTVHFSHEVVASAVYQASAAAGKPIVAGSLAFTYHRGNGFGGGSSVSATGDAGTEEDVASVAQAAAGRVSFPGTVTVYFGIDQLKNLLESAVRRDKKEASYVNVSYDEQKGASASITLKAGGGTISLDSAQLNAALTEELTAQGYSVVAEGFEYSYTRGSFGNRAGTSVTVTLSAVPVVPAKL